jgi:hypothetical protein
MELASRPRHAAEPGNRDKGLQVMQVHWVIRKADVTTKNYALDGGELASQMEGVLAQSENRSCSGTKE